MAAWTTSYSGLIGLISEFVEDDSTEFESAQQGIINRAEERLLQDLDLTFFDDETTSSTANGVATASKANTIISVQSIYFSAAAAYATRKTKDWLRLYGGSGRPLYFYEDDDSVHFAPTPDATYAYVMRFKSQPTPLSLSNTENWLTRNVAPLLLDAALVESEKFLIAPERVAEFNQAYASKLGPARAWWRDNKAEPYEPVAPTPTPVKER